MSAEAGEVVIPIRANIPDALKRPRVAIGTPERWNGKLTLAAWRALVCLVEPEDDDDGCPCTPATDRELANAGLIIVEPFRVTPAGLVAFGRLQHARRT